MVKKEVNSTTDRTTTTNVGSLDVLEYPVPPPGLVYCLCGCGGLLFITNEWGCERGYISGHQFRGKHHSEETRTRLSESHKGKHHTEEQKKKMHDAMIGHKLTEETKLKIGNSNRKVYSSIESRERLSNMLKKYHKIHPMSEATKRKISESQKGKWRIDMSNRYCSTCGSSRARSTDKSGRKGWNKIGGEPACNKCYMKEWHKNNKKRNRD